jgi:hypothetical protein
MDEGIDMTPVQIGISPLSKTLRSSLTGTTFVEVDILWPTEQKQLCLLRAGRAAGVET